jgi:pyruvate dehydrogenase E2 component (dihydrolipoamide acetyltransferase)
VIKFLELTAPESSEFRQAKIISVEVAEGDAVAVGDTLFKVRSGNNDYELPATKAGKITELIVSVDENISIMTPLLLLETEVEKSTATPPITEISDDGKSEKSTAVDTQDTEGDKAKKKRNKKKKKTSKKKSKKKTTPRKNQVEPGNSVEHQQQSLDLAEEQNLESPATDGLEERPEANNQSQTQASKSRNPTQVNNIMSSSTETKKVAVPDIGGDAAKVIEIHVKVGDKVEVDDSLITLESDKASMDVPCPETGVVASILAQLDQEMSEGDAILELTADQNEVDASQLKPEAKEDVAATNNESQTASASQSVDVTIPDIGGDSAKVIEILVKVGQEVQLEDPLVTLESDKASMDVPSSHTGVIESIELNLDQEVSEGMVVVRLSAVAEASSSEPTSSEIAAAPEQIQKAETSPPPAPSTSTESSAATNIASKPTGKSHASPSVRRFARELGVDLSKLSGSGRKGRISKADVKQFVKSVISGGDTSSSMTQAVAANGIPQMPSVDFSKFGEIEIQPLNRIKKLTATNLHRSWLNVPHVTHQDESNINDLEEFRKQLNSEYVKQNKPIKLSPLAFIVKAVVNALQTYPQFNSSLDVNGENLILKKYFNIGIAVETPNGLVVPVVKDADKLSVAEIATAMGELAAKARDKKLTTKDMSGAGFTISSLGGIGGTSFTPIVNAPEVAILGVSRSKITPVWDGNSFQPGTILPLSLSYDHRVIDGAEAARFTRHVAAVLEDVRRLAV